MMNRDLLRANEQFIEEEGYRLMQDGLMSDDVKEYLEYCYDNDLLVDTEKLVALVNEHIKTNSDEIIKHLMKGGPK